VNLLAEREVAPEFLQQRATPEALADALHTLLTDPAAAAAQRAGLRTVLDALHPPGLSPSEAAAEAVLAQLAVASAGTLAAPDRD
jgi:lipid-A-disaccharide synthase